MKLLTETAIMRAILALSVKSTRLFRNTVGSGYVGPHLQLGNGQVLMTRASRVSFGMGKGTSDIVGWRSVVITPEMVGQTIAQFVAIEVKVPKGRMTAEQANFIDTVIAHGGCAGVARSVEDAQELLQ